MRKEELALELRNDMFNFLNEFIDEFALNGDISQDTFNKAVNTRSNIIADDDLWDDQSKPLPNESKIFDILQDKFPDYNVPYCVEVAKLIKDAIHVGITDDKPIPSDEEIRIKANELVNNHSIGSWEHGDKDLFDEFYADGFIEEFIMWMRDNYLINNK